MIHFRSFSAVVDTWTVRAEVSRTRPRQPTPADGRDVSTLFNTTYIDHLVETMQSESVESGRWVDSAPSARSTMTRVSDS